MEAEGRTLRRSILRTGVALGILVMIGMVVLVAIGFCLAAIYLGLASALSPAISALLIGVGMFIIAVILTWIAISLSR